MGVRDLDFDGKILNGLGFWIGQQNPKWGMSVLLAKSCQQNPERGFVFSGFDSKILNGVLKSGLGIGFCRPSPGWGRVRVLDFDGKILKRCMNILKTIWNVGTAFELFETNDSASTHAAPE